jgi:hypothetical protein
MKIIFFIDVTSSLFSGPDRLEFLQPLVEPKTDSTKAFILVFHKCQKAAAGFYSYEH